MLGSVIALTLAPLSTCNDSLQWQWKDAESVSDRPLQKLRKNLGDGIFRRVLCAFMMLDNSEAGVESDTADIDETFDSKSNGLAPLSKVF